MSEEERQDEAERRAAVVERLTPLLLKHGHVDGDRISAYWLADAIADEVLAITDERQRVQS